MAYTGAGVGQGIAGFGEMFARLFGQMQERRDVLSENERRAALQAQEAQALADYRQGSLDLQRSGQEAAQRRYEADRETRAAERAADRAERTQRDGIATRQREQDRADRAREGGFEYTPATPGAIVPTGGFGGAIAAILPKEGKIGGYNPELDPRVQGQSYLEDRRHSNNMEEILARAGVGGARGAGGAGGAVLDPVARRELMTDAWEQSEELRRQAELAGGMGQGNLGAQLDAIAQGVGYPNYASFTQAIAGMTGAPGAMPTPDPSAPEGGRRPAPGAAAAVAGGGAPPSPPQQPWSPPAGGDPLFTGEVPAQGNPPQGGTVLGPEAINELAKMGAPEGVPDGAWAVALSQLAAGRTPLSILEEAQREGVPSSLRESLATALGIGR